MAGEKVYSPAVCCHAGIFLEYPLGCTKKTDELHSLIGYYLDQLSQWVNAIKDKFPAAYFLFKIFHNFYIRDFHSNVLCYYCCNRHPQGSPALRQTSLTVRPASADFRPVMIWCSVNRALRIAIYSEDIFSMSENL